MIQRIIRNGGSSPDIQATQVSSEANSRMGIFVDRVNWWNTTAEFSPLADERGLPDRYLYTSCTVPLSQTRQYFLKACWRSRCNFQSSLSLYFTPILEFPVQFQNQLVLLEFRTILRSSALHSKCSPKVHQTNAPSMLLIILWCIRPMQALLKCGSIEEHSTIYFYGCETSPLILREGHKLQQLESKFSSKHLYPRRINLLRNFGYYIPRKFVIHTGHPLE